MNRRDFLGKLKVLPFLGLLFKKREKPKPSNIEDFTTWQEIHGTISTDAINNYRYIYFVDSSGKKVYEHTEHLDLSEV